MVEENKVDQESLDVSKNEINNHEKSSIDQDELSKSHEERHSKLPIRETNMSKDDLIFLNKEEGHNQVEPTV